MDNTKREEIEKKFKNIVSGVIEEIKVIDHKEALKLIWKEADELQFLLEKKPRILMVAGNIGLGKSTASKIISTFGKIRIDMEAGDKEMLKLFYDDMGLYAERLQLDLICQRLNQIVINGLLYPGQSIIYDRTPYEDPIIFARVLHHHQLLSRESMEFCEEYFLIKRRELLEHYPETQFEPDLIIMLQISVEEGWKRVHTRQRETELRDDAEKGHGLTLEYYELLDKYYKSFPEDLLNKRWYQGPILRLEEDELVVSDATHTRGQLYVIRCLKEALKII
jgi:deoxyadenosine/deoxycytidine kinase